MEEIRHLIETIRSGDSGAAALARWRLGELAEAGIRRALLRAPSIRAELGSARRGKGADTVDVLSNSDLGSRGMSLATDIAHQPILIEKLLLRIENGEPPDEAFGRVIASKARQIGDKVNPNESLRHDYHRALRESREKGEIDCIFAVHVTPGSDIETRIAEAVDAGIISSPIRIVASGERITLFCASCSRNSGRKLGVSKREPFFGPKETLRTIIDANPDDPLSALRHGAASEEDVLKAAAAVHSLQAKRRKGRNRSSILNSPPASEIRRIVREILEAVGKPVTDRHLKKAVYRRMMSVIARTPLVIRGLDSAKVDNQIVARDETSENPEEE